MARFTARSLWETRKDRSASPDRAVAAACPRAHALAEHLGLFVVGITVAIASLTEGCRTAFVEASAEDLGRYAFDFEELPNDRIRLRLLQWAQWSSARSGGTNIFEVECPRMPLLRAFWRGLQELRGRCTASEFEREWRWPMPMRELDQLGERLRERR